MRLLLVAAALLGTVHVAPTASRSAQRAITESFERFARDIVVLGPGHFLYGFRDARVPASAAKPIVAFARFLDTRAFAAADFTPLLKHDNARVRSLAIVALYSLEDAQVLPAIYALVGDTAQTFPDVMPTASLALNNARIDPATLRTQTVGDLATAVITFYMERGGYYYGPNGAQTEPGFKEYWHARANRTSAAGWWTVRLARAGHGTSPTLSERLPALRRLRMAIDALREPDRTYVLLWLNGESGSDGVVSERELLDLTRALGRESLLDLVKRRIRSTDPDLQPRPSNNYPYARMVLFVLQHAPSLLQAEDGAVLLAQETWERDYQTHRISDPLISPWFAIAAAALDPRDARSLLVDAYARFQGQYDAFHRLTLAEAAWRQLGADQSALVVDWFYQEVARPTSQESSVLERLLNTENRPARALMTALIADRRFDELNWKSIEVLVRKVNALQGRVVVSDDELRSVYSPIGFDFYMRDTDKALAQYPNEAKRLLEKMARWRQVLREAVTR